MQLPEGLACQLNRQSNRANRLGIYTHWGLTPKKIWGPSPNINYGYTRNRGNSVDMMFKGMLHHKAK